LSWLQLDNLLLKQPEREVVARTLSRRIPAIRIALATFCDIKSSPAS
jgi:hypothetical protein